MKYWNYDAVLCSFGESAPLPTSDNDNFRLMADWMTIAEFMQVGQASQGEAETRGCPPIFGYAIALSIA